MTEKEFIKRKYPPNYWGIYPPSRRLIEEWLKEYADLKAKEAYEAAKYIEYLEAQLDEATYAERKKSIGYPPNVTHGIYS